MLEWKWESVDIMPPRFARTAARHEDDDMELHIVQAALTHMEGTTAAPGTESARFYDLGMNYVETYGNLPTAVIASRPHIFGEARIFETVAGGRSPELTVTVVKTWREAAIYLQLDLTAAESEAQRLREA